MNCDEVQLQLSAYLDDEISETERQRIDSHLNTCADCREVLSQLYEMQAFYISELTAVEVSGDIESRVLSQIQKTSNASSHYSIQLHRLSRIFGAVGLTAAVFIVFILLSPVGLLMRAGYHLFTAMLGGIFQLSGFMGTYWIAAFVVFFILLASLSLFGVIRLLKSVRREVLL